MLNYQPYNKVTKDSVYQQQSIINISTDTGTAFSQIAALV